MPKHAIGQAAVDSLRHFGVDTSKIVRGGERVGIYYLEKGASQRGSVCISNEEDAKDVFGIEAENTDIYGGKLNHQGYKSVAKQLADKFYILSKKSNLKSCIKIINRIRKIIRF